MAERDIRKALKARVEAYGGEIRAVSWLGRRNAPDVLCLFPAYCWYSRRQCRDIWDGPKDTPKGHNVYVETKIPRGVPTAAQQREHERMRTAGCVVLVISTLEQLDEWLPPV